MTDRMRRKPSLADQYRRLWRPGAPPDLRQFLAGHPAVGPDELLDLIETDRAERWRRGDRVKAERYLKHFPILKQDLEATLVVIYGEYYLSKDLGETPSLMDFIARFPEHARRLRDQIMWHEAIELGNVFGTAVAPVIPGLAVGELLGQGGMSTVYRATDEHSGGDVAVKVLDAGQLQNLLRVARFRREISSLMRLTHPNIVTGFQTGDIRGLPYLVMEYCAGGPLSEYLKGRVIPPGTAANILRDLASAVEYAHGKGVIHRDMKPANVLLSLTRGAATNPTPASNGSATKRSEQPALVEGDFPFIPKVSDFGLAKCLIGTESGITATRETLGTPCYMAPELTTGARDADARTDVYGLGAILYELLTGRPPFIASAPLEVVRMVREDLPIPPRDVNPDIPDDLLGICVKCLQKDPADRFQSAAEVGEALPGTREMRAFV